VCVCVCVYVWGTIFKISFLNSLEIYTTSLLTVVSMLCSRSQKLSPMSTWNSTLWPASPATPLPQTLVITFPLSASVCSASVHSTYRWKGSSFLPSFLSGIWTPDLAHTNHGLYHWATAPFALPFYFLLSPSMPKFKNFPESPFFSIFCFVCAFDATTKKSSNLMWWSFCFAV
jgi:multisubunit Na+/H+ antiporter MnhC subunit